MTDDSVQAPARLWRPMAALAVMVATVCACGGPGRDATAEDGFAEPARAAALNDEATAAPANDAADRAKDEAPPAEAGEPDREGEDWAQFLGPRGTGVSGETTLLAAWPKGGPPILWEKTVGTGYSAPSIRGNRLVLHHRLGAREIVECLRADNGESLWKHAYRSDYSDPYGYNNGPRCSPLLTADRCYTYGAEGKLACLDLKTGERLWMRDAQAEWKLPEWFFGIGCSPVLEGDLIIALIGGQPDSGVVAFNKQTGATVWEAMGQKTWDGAETDRRGGRPYKWTGDEQVVSYSSPHVATIHGKRHLLVLGRQGLVSLDPATGKENFRYWFSSHLYESVNAARPIVIGDDRILLTAAYEAGSALLKVRPDGKGYDVVWRNKDNLQCHWSTPIAVEGFAYGFSGRNERDGELRCIDLKTGEIAWSTTGFDGSIADLDPVTAGTVKDTRTGQVIPIPFYGRGSKIQIGERFLVLGERGKLSLLKVNPEKWEELGSTSYEQITYPAWTAPVLSRGRLYLRDEDSLICLDAMTK